MYYIYIDEAGRGPLAWPVQVGLIIENVPAKITVWNIWHVFPARDIADYISYKDSKILSEGTRNRLFKELQDNKKIQRSTAKISAKDIDRYWIVWALRQGIMRALHAHFVGGKYSVISLTQWIQTIDYQITLVIDGPSDFGLKKALWITVVPVIDGDAKIPMISAASIIAKVERDAYMYRVAKRLPQYDFHLHKGYWTKGHFQAIQKYWLSKEHRVTYIHK